MGQPIVTISRHIIDMERQFPEATGAFSTILQDIAFAAKMIARVSLRISSFLPPFPTEVRATNLFREESCPGGKE